MNQAGLICSIGTRPKSVLEEAGEADDAEVRLLHVEETVDGVRIGLLVREDDEIRSLRLDDRAELGESAEQRYFGAAPIGLFVRHMRDERDVTRTGSANLGGHQFRQVVGADDEHAPPADGRAPYGRLPNRRRDENTRGDHEKRGAEL